MNFVKWLSTPQAKIVAAAAKEKALAEFKERFPNVDMSQLTTEVETDEKITQQDKSNSWSADRDSRKIRTRLMKRTGAQPCELPWVLEISPISSCWAKMRIKTHVPAVDFADGVASVGGLFNREQNINVTPTENFTAKFREIFTNTQMKHKSGKDGPKRGFVREELLVVPATPSCRHFRDDIRSAPCECRPVAPSVCRNRCSDPALFVHRYTSPLHSFWFLC